jgi:N-acetylmuramoyl-L-alanine amidase
LDFIRDRESWERDRWFLQQNLKKLLTAPTPSTTPPQKLYKVQVGAYSVNSNADAMLAKVKAAGFTDAFIKTE